MIFFSLLFSSFSLFSPFSQCFKRNPWKNEKKEENSGLHTSRRKISVVICGLLSLVEWQGKLSMVCSSCWKRNAALMFYCSSCFWKFLRFSILRHTWHKSLTILRMRLHIFLYDCLWKFLWHSGNILLAPVDRCWVRCRPTKLDGGPRGSGKINQRLAKKCPPNPSGCPLCVLCREHVK